MSVIIGSVVGFIALFLMVLTFDHPEHVALEAACSPFEWLLPMSGLVFAVALIWLLMMHASRSDRSYHEPEGTCSHCGRSIRSDWRLCPYCGDRVDLSDTSDVAAR